MAQLHFASYKNDLRLTHYLFRFPAKFHPAAVRCLLDRYSRVGDIVLDPFCGSGTLLVEALVAGRNAVGIDVDPVAAFISRVKCRTIAPARLERALDVVLDELSVVRRSSSDYDRLTFQDLSTRAIGRYGRRYSIPPIPNLTHWFRTYVALDLAK